MAEKSKGFSPSAEKRPVDLSEKPEEAVPAAEGEVVAEGKTAQRDYFAGRFSFKYRVSNS